MMTKSKLEAMQRTMRERYESPDAKNARAAARLRRVILYLEQFPCQAHADAMRILEKAWIDLRVEWMQAAQDAAERKRAERVRFRKREEYVS